MNLLKKGFSGGHVGFVVLSPDLLKVHGDEAGLVLVHSLLTKTYSRSLLIFIILACSVFMSGINETAITEIVNRRHGAELTVYNSCSQPSWILLSCEREEDSVVSVTVMHLKEHYSVTRMVNKN